MKFDYSNSMRTIITQNTILTSNNWLPLFDCNKFIQSALSVSLNNTKPGVHSRKLWWDLKVFLCKPIYFSFLKSCTRPGRKLRKTRCYSFKLAIIGIVWNNKLRSQRSLKTVTSVIVFCPYSIMTAFWFFDIIPVLVTVVNSSSSCWVHVSFGGCWLTGVAIDFL